MNPIHVEDVRLERQRAVQDWAQRCFGEATATSTKERALRILEEVIELCQVEGLDPGKLKFLVDYVFQRPVGRKDQEIGGIAVTTLIYCAAAGLSADLCETNEIQRILDKDPNRFTTRQAEKRASGITAI